ncbi:MAG: LLM class F420-dependent oxidoreductase [Actinomycetota bacterium]|nr:LLM class F420-dependent oxidoreductase [Actinomycetota bacterium]
MRFGVFVPQGWRFDLAGVPVTDHWDVIADAARTAEALGYESVWVYDHFHTSPAPSQEVTYEAWTLMAALAAVTDTVRLGQMCTCNGYRQPSYLAKVAASIDVISAGRLEMGIGAGWYEHEFDGYGYPFPKPSVRLGQLEEAVEIMRRMWTEDVVSFDGKHYHLDGAICRPHPVQQPHIPLWVAGGGEQLTLRIAARYAAATNFGDTIEQFARKSEVLADHCAQVGTDFDVIVRSNNFNVLCEATEADVAARLDWITERYTPLVGESKAARVRALYTPMAGTPQQLIERFGSWQEAGMSYAIMFFPEFAFDSAGVERFATEVVPALS